MCSCRLFYTNPTVTKQKQNKKYCKQTTTKLHKFYFFKIYLVRKLLRVIYINIKDYTFWYVLKMKSNCDVIDT